MLSKCDLIDLATTLEDNAAFLRETLVGNLDLPPIVAADCAVQLSKLNAKLIKLTTNVRRADRPPSPPPGVN